MRWPMRRTIICSRRAKSIVRQDAEGDSMFVLMTGHARVVLEPSGQEVAVIPAGGFFGEMSMLTGDKPQRHGQGGR